MNELGKAFLTIFGAIVGLAILSVILSPRSQAAQVIQAGSSALSNVVAAAVTPVASPGANGNLGENSFTNPSSIEDFLYNTTQGQYLAKDVYSTIHGLGVY